MCVGMSIFVLLIEYANMGYQKYLKQLWKKPKQNFGAEAWKNFLVKLRTEPALVRLEHPTRLDRAHALGFKAKQGFIVVRTRVPKSARKREHFHGGRKASKRGMFLKLRLSTQGIAEMRASRHYPNCEVLNSYWVARDGRHKWYEVILVDRDNPVIKADPKISWIANQRGRANRGLTAAGKKSRGL